MKLENANKAIELIKELNYLKEHPKNATMFNYTSLNFTFNNNDGIISIDNQDICRIMLDNLKDELENKIDIIENELKDL